MPRLSLSSLNPSVSRGVVIHRSDIQLNQFLCIHIHFRIRRMFTYSLRCLLYLLCNLLTVGSFLHITHFRSFQPLYFRKWKPQVTCDTLKVFLEKKGLQTVRIFGGPCLTAGEYPLHCFWLGIASKFLMHSIAWNIFLFLLIFQWKMWIHLKASTQQ